jgi:isochorismate hydrolase
VQHTVVDAFYLNYEICVIRDGVSSPHRDAHEYALNYMRQYHRAKIITSDQAIAYFRNDPEAINSNALVPPDPSYKEWTLASRS